MTSTETGAHQTRLSHLELCLFYDPFFMYSLVETYNFILCFLMHVQYYLSLYIPVEIYVFIFKKLLHPDRSYFDSWKCNSSLRTQIIFSWWVECLVLCCNALEDFSFIEVKFLSQLCCSHQEVGFWHFWSECLFWNYHTDSFIIRCVYYWDNILNHLKKILKCKFHLILKNSKWINQ